MRAVVAAAYLAAVVHGEGQAEVTGMCSAADLAILKALPPGTGGGSIGGIASSCGHSAYSIFSGWNMGSFNSCLTSKTGVSTPCASCFGTAGAYGANNCKWDCMSSWCSAGCLKCTSSAVTRQHTCTGMTPAPVQPCLSDPVEPLERLAAMEPKEEPVSAPAASCTAADLATMKALPAGTAGGSLGTKAAACGKSAYSIWSGWNMGKFTSCMSQSAGISAACAGCYGTAGAYGANNCKWDCISSWCSAGCLQCTSTATAAADTCAGMPQAKPMPCLAEVPAAQNVTGNMQCIHPFPTLVSGTARQMSERSILATAHGAQIAGGADTTVASKTFSESVHKANIKIGMFRIDEYTKITAAGAHGKDASSDPEKDGVDTVIYDFTTKMVTKAFALKKQGQETRSGCTKVHVPSMPAPANLVKAWNKAWPKMRAAIPWKCEGHNGAWDTYELTYQKKAGESMTPTAAYIFGKQSPVWNKAETASYTAYMEVGAQNRVQSYRHSVLAVGPIDYQEVYAEAFDGGSVVPPTEAEFDDTSNKLGKCTHAAAHEETGAEKSEAELLILDLWKEASKIEQSEVIV